MKRLFAALLTLSVMFSVVVTGAVPAAAAPAENEDASKYVTLDGDWHYKQYRTYAQMFQYFPYMPALSLGKWTDAEAAVLPDADTWKSWDTYSMPYDNPETGGLFTNDIAPTWSEAWAVREFDLPENFTDQDEVTLLMGIIDDNDVVYINGTAVAASGFANGNGEPIIDVPATGGFNYTAEDPTDQVKWVKSYWEIQREYTIPADVLIQGGTNEIAVRLYNNNSNGGFYAGNLYAICGNDLAVRALKGLPTEKVECEDVEIAVARQNAALANEDYTSYYVTISPDYHNDAADKAAKMAEAEALMEAYDDIAVADENAAVYLDDEGNYWYSAQRTVTGVRDGEEVVISSGAVELCFELVKGGARELGNWNRCYGSSYDSALFGEQLTYSVYLPPSYYEDEDADYPVVWLLHGRASSSTSYRDVDDIGAFMDELIESGEVMEMVVIMPDSGKYAFYRDSELTPGDKENSGPWATQLTEELREEINSIYRVRNQAEFNGLTGNSMGGYGSMVIGTSNPDLYSSIAIHMGYLPEDALESLKSLSEAELADYDFYLDCGLQDQTVGTSGTIAVHEYLESVEKEHGYDLRDGSHNSAFYMSGMTDSMKMHSDHFAANEADKGSSSIVNKPTEPADEPDPSEDYIDLDEDAWYADAVDYVIDQGLMTGVAEGEFAPDGLVTRAALVQMLWAMSGKPVVNYAMDFEDVAQDAWYAEAVRWAASEGVAAGMGDKIFAPDAAITREQLAVMLYRVEQKNGGGFTGLWMFNLDYADADQISEWAYEAMCWCTMKGIIGGRDDGTVDPQGVAARSECAQMLMQYASL